MRRFLLFILTFTFYTGIFLTSCSNNLISVSHTKIALGTYVKITIITSKKDKENADSIIYQNLKKISDFEIDFDYRNSDGELSEFNNGTHILKDDNSKLFSLLKDSISYAKTTNGYFDPTILPIIQLWGFDTDNPHLPLKDEVEEALMFVGYEKIELYMDRIIKPQSVKFDLSGVAKGKVVNLIRDYLKKEGYYDFLIDAGGDIYVSGKNIHKKKWRIAIQDPIQKSQFSGILEKTDTAIVTSGDYERFFIKDGIKYCHIFNPKTGYPFSDCRSVTVLSPDTAFADTIATAVFAMGSKDGYNFLDENNIEGYIIFSSGGNNIDSRSTPGFWK